MAKQKKKGSSPNKKGMSEGTAIAFVVIGLTIGGVAAYYLLRWFLELFFPSLIN